jgi:hypothetical protein
MRFNTRLFVILWLAGFAGVISILAIDFNGLIAILPGEEIPAITPALKILSLVQPSILLAIAVLVGVALARKVGLSAPIAEAATGGGDWVSALKPQIVPGISGGLAGGFAVVSIAALARSFLAGETAARISEFGKSVPLLTRLLYGGITEELLLRWGFMTLLVWAAWRIFQKKRSAPSPACFVGAIMCSALVFGVGHLPIAFLLFPEATLALILFVIVGNSVFGLFAGWLYWRKGLESAIIAHATAHVVMFAASYFGAYF